ncbi:MAG: hypothetical protein ABI574_02845 [Burkholderiales bacterium]
MVQIVAARRTSCKLAVAGVMQSILSFLDYFSDSRLRSYFWNMLGYIHYELPGVFLGNPIPNIVNGSLWTVPFELECYVALAILALSRLTSKHKWLFLLFVGLCLAVMTFGLLSQSSAAMVPPAVQGRVLVLCFLAGVVLNLIRHRVPFRSDMAVVSAVFAVFLLRNQNLVYLAPLPVAYVTAWLGLHRPKKVPVLMDGDYSYGIYLYAVPIQQTVFQLTSYGRTYSGNLVLSLFFLMLFAAFSWHVIEKPTLRIKSLFSGSIPRGQMSRGSGFPQDS